MCAGGQAGVEKQSRTPYQRLGRCPKRVRGYCTSAGKVSRTGFRHRTGDREGVRNASASSAQALVRCPGRACEYVPDAGKMSRIGFRHRTSRRARVRNGLRDRAEAPGWGRRQAAGMAPVSERCLGIGRRVELGQDAQATDNEGSEACLGTGWQVTGKEPAAEKLFRWNSALPEAEPLGPNAASSRRFSYADRQPGGAAAAATASANCRRSCRRRTSITRSTPGSNASCPPRPLPPRRTMVGREVDTGRAVGRTWRGARCST